MSMPDIVVAFDVYGTVLSTQSIAEKLAALSGPAEAQAIATTWRKYQLEYTWRLNSMGLYEDFSKLTRQSLQHAVRESGQSLDAEQTDELMAAYDQLTIFPDVVECLESLAATDNIRAVLFSNGTHEMVSKSVARAQGLSKYAHVFSEIVTVDEVKKFKPAPETYWHLAEKVGKDPNNAERMRQIWLVTGNPFDVVGARAVGMRAVWVDRAGTGWQDALRLGDEGRPTAVVDSLQQVREAVSRE